MYQARSQFSNHRLFSVVAHGDSELRIRLGVIPSLAVLQAERETALSGVEGDLARTVTATKTTTLFPDAKCAEDEVEDVVSGGNTGDFVERT
jgi:hypothetical protein